MDHQQNQNVSRAYKGGDWCNERYTHMLELDTGNGAEFFLQAGEQRATPTRHQWEMDLLKRHLAKAEQSRREAEQSRDRAEEGRKNAQLEVATLTRQLNAMRFAQAELVNWQEKLNKLLAEERGNVQKMAAKLETLERKNGELVNETVGLGEQCRLLKLANTQLQVEMDCMSRSQQSTENDGDNDNCNKVLAEQLRKVQVERDALMEQSLEQKAQMFVLNGQMLALQSQCEELKQTKEELDWMMTNKDELIAVELEKFKSQMLVDGGMPTTTAVNEDDELRRQMKKLTEELQAAETARERAEQHERAQEVRLHAMELELKEEQRAKKNERARRKTLKKEVKKLNRQLDHHHSSGQKKAALAKRTSDSSSKTGNNCG